MLCSDTFINVLTFSTFMNSILFLEEKQKCNPYAAFNTEQQSSTVSLETASLCYRLTCYSMTKSKSRVRYACLLERIQTCCYHAYHLYLKRDNLNDVYIELE